MIGGLLRILVIGLVALVAAMMLMPRIPEPAIATVLDEPRPLPVVALTDQNNMPFFFDDLRGEPVLVFFGFTNCPDICPLTLAAIAQAMPTLRDRDIAPRVVFVSVDPARDTPAQIRAYLSGFDPQFIGVTADDIALSPLLETLAVSVHKETVGRETYNVVHNGTIYALNDDGDWAALFGGSSHTPQDIISDYPKLRMLLETE